MKEGWTYKKLGEVCEVISGQSPDGKSYNNEGKGTPFYQGKKEFTIKYIGNPTTWTSEETKIAMKDDILMSVRAPVGDINFATQRVCIGRGLAAIRPNTLIDKDYLFYFLLSEKNNIKGKEGAVFPSINRKEIMDISISYPIFSEQQRIVSRLDSAFAHIDELKANAEKQLSEARVLFQKALTKAMEPKKGWEEKTLGQLGDLKNGMNFAHNEKGVDLHILGVGDFGNRFSIDDVRELQMISLNQQPSEDYLLKDGDIVFVRSNGNKQLVGRSLVVYTGNNPTTFSGFCIRFRKSLKVLDERFLVYFLKSENTRKKLFGNGANISNLNQKILQSLIVPLPPLAEQQRIVVRLDALSENIRKYEEIQRQIISECDALKQALLRQVFE